jgi:hypothetical protein
MKKSILTSIALTLFVSFGFAMVQTDIEKANKSGNAVFLVVTETGNANNAAAINLGKEAQKLSSKSTVIELNRSDKANESLVAKYRLAGAGLPLILVIASNGTEAGGVAYMKQTTAESLVALIPSPKKAEVLKVLNDGKPVFLVVSKKSMTKKEVLSKCETACADMKDGAKVVEVDFDDAVEKKFLSSLKITEIGAEPQTYVINTQGQVAGSYTGVTDSKTLVATATKKASSGCCAPGSGKKCEPTKK